MSYLFMFLVWVLILGLHWRTTLAVAMLVIMPITAVVVVYAVLTTPLVFTLTLLAIMAGVVLVAVLLLGITNYAKGRGSALVG